MTRVQGSMIHTDEWHKKYMEVCVDHSHSDDEVRGILCGPCNRGLGLFDDNVKRMQKACRYLRRDSPIEDVYIKGNATHNKAIRDKLMQLTNNQCPICRKTMNNRGKRFIHLDHNHQTNVVRGLLCSACNTGLGQFGDNAEILESAIEYLTHTLSERMGCF